MHFYIPAPRMPARYLACLGLTMGFLLYYWGSYNRYVFEGLLPFLAWFIDHRRRGRHSPATPTLPLPPSLPPPGDA